MGNEVNRGNGRGIQFLRQAALSEGDECINWPFYRMKNGYGQVGTHSGMTLAHRYVCELVHGLQPENKPQALHGCGNRSCVNPRHLRWGTQSENEQDKLDHGTWFTRMGGAKLTASVVRDIRVRASEGLSLNELSAAFSTPKSTIKKIVNRVTWKHV